MKIKGTRRRLMMTSTQAFRRLALILSIFTCLALAHSFWLPLHEAPDEVAHFLYSRFIAENGRLPLDYDERQAAGYRSDWPALYHVIVAAATGWADSQAPPYLKFVWESPRFEMARELLNTKRLANTEDEFWPYRGVVLMWHLGRLVSIGLSMATILIAFFSALEIFPGDYWRALVSASIVAFIPTFVFISSSLSDDTLTGLLLGLYVWILIKTVKGDCRIRNFVWLGLLMGLAATTKYSTVLLPIQAVGVMTYLAWQYAWGWLGWLQRITITAVAAIIAASWWYLTLIIYFNEIDEYGWLIGSLKPILAGGIDASQKYAAYVLTQGRIGIPDSPEFIAEPFWAWALYLYQSFWAREIESFPLGPVAQALIGIVCLISVFGLFQLWRRQREPRLWIALFLSQILLFLALPALRHAIQGNVSQTAQGRHLLFPIATVFPLLLVYGWQGWLSPQTQRRLALALVGGLLCWSMAQLIRVIDYPIYYLPVRTTAEAAAEIPHRLDQTFGDHLLLIGYDSNLAPAEGALKLKLYWQSPTYVDEDYLITVTLLQAGQTVLRWTLYPLNGLYPTRIWESWETIRDDIGLPLVDLSPGKYQLQLQVQSVQGTVLPAGEKDTLILDEITVPEPVPTQPDVPLPVSVEGRTVVEGITLWQAERYRRFDLPEYKPRMQIPFVWQGQPGPSERVEWLLVDPQGQVYLATPVTEHFGYFPVGLDWPSGDYRLRVEVWRNDTVISSQESEPLARVINKSPRLLEPPPIARPIEANFANRVKLLGYDLPARSLARGQGVPVTLYWQGLRTMGQDYTVFAKLLDDRQRVWGSADRLPADGYHTFYWLENEVVIDGFELPVDPAVPNGVYWLNVGLYEEVNQAAVSLPLVVNDQQTDVTSVTFGPVKIGGPPPGVVVPAISPDRPLTVDLGDVIRLRGYDLTQNPQNLDLTLYWESLASTPIDYTVFVHIRNQAGATIAQMDRPPVDGAYPTSLWAAGELIPDRLLVPLAQDLPAGEYLLVVGMYDFATGARLPVSADANGEISLSKIIKP